jgi:hypothetical protein
VGHHKPGAVGVHANARDYGDRFWLYVVEYSFDEALLRVHPIRNPADQITVFMFDGNWRGAAIEDGEDPSAMFMVGARVATQGVGTGTILSVTSRGITKLLAVQYDGQEEVTPNVVLNLSRMRVLKNSDGKDNT